MACFEYRDEAEVFEKGMKERLNKFGLEVTWTRPRRCASGTMADRTTGGLFIQDSSFTGGRIGRVKRE
jgi:hypothetical protein